MNEAEQRIRTLFDRLNLPEADRRELMGEVDRLLDTDPLTGCLNRRNLDRRLESFRTVIPGGRPLMALVDVDHFKQLNDTYGHQAGDRCLRQVSGRIRREAGDGVTLIRMGGDEFLFLTPERPTGDPVEWLEFLARGVDVEVQPAGRECHRVTLSAGIVIPGPDDSVDQLLERVDRALYTSKKRGRNRCTLWSAPPTGR